MEPNPLNGLPPAPSYPSDHGYPSRSSPSSPGMAEYAAAGGFCNRSSLGRPVSETNGPHPGSLEQQQQAFQLAGDVTHVHISQLQSQNRYPSPQQGLATSMMESSPTQPSCDEEFANYALHGSPGACGTLIQPGSNRTSSPRGLSSPEHLQHCVFEEPHPRQNITLGYCTPVSDDGHFGGSFGMSRSHYQQSSVRFNNRNFEMADAHYAHYPVSSEYPTSHLDALPNMAQDEQSPSDARLKLEEDLPVTAPPSDYGDEEPYRSSYPQPSVLIGTETAMSDGTAKQEEPYARLIHQAFMSNSRHAMTLQELYQWFRENTDKAKREGKGWQNSIRHNLSMNGVGDRGIAALRGELLTLPHRHSRSENESPVATPTSPRATLAQKPARSPPSGSLSRGRSRMACRAQLVTARGTQIDAPVQAPRLAIPRRTFGSATSSQLGVRAQAASAISRRARRRLQLRAVPPYGVSTCMSLHALLGPWASALFLQQPSTSMGCIATTATDDTPWRLQATVTSPSRGYITWVVMRDITT